VHFGHDTLIYHFINLYLLLEEIKNQRMNSVVVRASILSGAPYEKDMSDGIISLFDDLKSAANPFRYLEDEEEKVDDEELFELWKKMSKQG
jgi:hypothetical protein